MLKLFEMRNYHGLFNVLFCKSQNGEQNSRQLFLLLDLYDESIVKKKKYVRVNILLLLLKAV